jgi:hypothetical protein
MLIYIGILFTLMVIVFLIQIQPHSQSRLVRVIYENNTSGMIKRKQLEECIVSGSIKKFFRSTGWVTISIDPIRKTNYGHLRERREIATC